MRTDTAILASKPERTRLAASRGGKPRVERTGGRYGAGVIRGFSVITRGEALGHRMWNDAETLQQTAAAINARSGTKARFTHPSVSGDGLGTLLGHVSGPAKVVGDQVIADLHLLQSAHSTPDGDLAGYVMDLAEESPEAFGASIVFLHDIEAEDAFEEAHLQNGKFQSPDSANVNHYPHVRQSKLLAVDVVDDPAANPSGLFSRGQEIPAEAEALFAYAWGLESERPDSAILGVDPDRARAFVARYCEARGLSLVPKAERPVTVRAEIPPGWTPEQTAAVAYRLATDATPAAPQKSAAQLAAERAEYERQEAEKRKRWLADVTAEYCESHGISKLGQQIRHAGGPSLQTRAIEWDRAGRPKLGTKPAAKPTGLASLIRFAKGTQILPSKK